MINGEKTFTPGEASVASCASVKAIHREIDQGPLKAARGRNGSKRFLCEADLVYLACATGLDNRLLQLTREGRDKLHQTIAAHYRHRRRVREIPLFSGGISFDLKSALKQVRTNLALLDRARKQVVENPEIRGGEPCIAGTRIGVYEVSAMLDQGEPEDELLAGYPSLRAEQLHLARIYARAYPRRGRPPRHFWHAGAARIL